MFYAIDELDTVLPIDLPPMNTGAPAPHVTGDGRTIRLEYNEHADVNWDNPLPPDSSIVTVIFERAIALYLGYPNEEVIRSHPLFDRGLQWYGFYHIISSSWIRAMERANRIHDRHSPELFARENHYLITFHDSTFECVAGGYAYSRRPGELV